MLPIAYRNNRSKGQKGQDLFDSHVIINCIYKVDITAIKFMYTKS